VFNLIGQSDISDGRLRFFAEKCRQELHQLRGLIAVAADHRFQRIERVKQKMRFTWACRRLNFRLRQQRFLAFILPGEDLRRKRDPLPSVRLMG
jgi:hypothetical protein